MVKQELRRAVRAVLAEMREDLHKQYVLNERVLEDVLRYDEEFDYLVARVTALEEALKVPPPEPPEHKARIDALNELFKVMNESDDGDD